MELRLDRIRDPTRPDVLISDLNLFDQNPQKPPPFLFFFFFSSLSMADDAPIYDLRKSLEKLKVETIPPLSSDIEKSNLKDDSLDLWCEDDVIDDAFGQSSALNREWNRRHEQFHTAGYREGITAGKEASAQEGFNVGFKKSAHVGYNWGMVRGITSAFGKLPDHLKERLAGKLENKDKLQNLCGSVQSSSTTDALKMYHYSIQCTEEATQNHSELNSQTEDSSSSCQLDTLYNELISLLYTSQEIDITMKSGQEML